MNISEKEVKIMKILEGVSPSWGMKARRIANELYGPTPTRRETLRDGHKISGAIAELSGDGLIKDARDNTPGGAKSWVPTDKGRNLLKKMKD